LTWRERRAQLRAMQAADTRSKVSSETEVSLQEWKDDIATCAFEKEALNRLVMNYLVIEGYKETAETFAAETGLDPGFDLESIADRMATRNAIQSGNVQFAIEKANDLDPLILDQNPQLYFHLQQQKLIELIRANQIEAALQFAQEELAPRGEENVRILPVCAFNELSTLT